MGGKSNEVTIGYNYFMGLHEVACVAPVDGMSALYFDDREAWVGPVGTPQITVNAPDLFGGKEREGGVAGHVDYLGGTVKNGVDPATNDYLIQTLDAGVYELGSASTYESSNPALVPGFFGVASLVFRRFMWGNNPYIKRMRQRWHNIFGTWEPEPDSSTYAETGGWYPEYAPICEEFDIRDMSVHIAFDNSGSMATGSKDAEIRAAVKTLLGNLASDGSNISLRIQPFNTSAGTAFERIPFESTDLSAAETFIDNIPTPTGDTHFDEGISSAAQFYSDADSALLGSESYGNFDPAVSGSVGSRVEDNDLPSQIARVVVFFSDGYANPSASAADAKTILDTIAGVAVYGFGITGNDSLWTIDNTPGDGVPVMNEDASNMTSLLQTPFRTWADLNAAHIIRDVLINPSSGGSGDATEIGSTFATAAATLYAEGMGFSFHWRNPSDRSSFLDLVNAHANSIHYFDRVTGKWELKLIRHDYDVGSLFTFDNTIITDWINFEKPQQFELPNHLTLIYTDRDNGEDASISDTNTAAVHVTGRVIPEKVELKGITCPELASKILQQRELRARTNPFARGEFRAAYIPTDLNLGSAFIVNEPRMGINGMVCRITEIEETDGKDNSIIIRFAEDVFQYDTADAGLVTDDVPTTGTQNMTAQESTIIFYEEVAYYDQVLIRGQSDIDTLLTSDEDFGNWQMTGNAFDSSHVSAAIVRNDTSAWVQVASAQLMPVWTISSTLARRADATSFTTAITGRESELVAGQIIQINDERMRLDSVTISGTTATFHVGRGCLDTVPAEHAAGSAVMSWDGYVGSDAVNYTAGESIETRFLPRTFSDTLDINDATSQTLYMDSRAIRPYPVGKLQVENSYAPTSELSGTVTVSWAHRNRLTQTSLAILDHTDATITPESSIALDLVRRLVNVSGGVETIVPIDETAISSPESTTSTTTDLDELVVYAGADTAYAEIGVKASRGSPAYDNWQTPFVRFLFAPYGGEAGLPEDTYFDDVALLYRFNLADESTSAPDNEGYLTGFSGSLLGSAKHDNAQTKHYDTALDLTGTWWGFDTNTPDDVNDITVYDSAGSITMELWARPTSFAAIRTMVTNRISTGVARGFEFRIDTDGSLRLALWNSSGTLVGDIQSSAGAVSTGAWQHLAAVRNGTRDWELFVDGQSVATGSQTAEAGQATGAEFTIGRLPSDTGRYFVGHIDSFRWTAGIARYITNFTPLEFWVSGEGTAAQSTPTPTQGASGNVTGGTFTGTAAQTSTIATQSASGSIDGTVTGTANQNALMPTQSASGTIEITGTASQMPMPPTQSASGGSGVGTHQYWRLRFNAGNGNTSIRAREIELRDTVSGSDLTSPGDAGTKAFSSGGVAANAFDDVTTYCQVATSSSHIGWDFGSGNDVEIIEIGFMTTSNATYAFGDCDVQYSDNGSDWTTSWNIVESSWAAATLQVYTKP